MVVTRSGLDTDSKKATSEEEIESSVQEDFLDTTDSEEEEATRDDVLAMLEDDEDEETIDRCVQEEALDYFLRCKAAQFFREHPDVKQTLKKKAEIRRAGKKEWASMTDSDKAQYVVVAEKMFTRLRLYVKGWSECECICCNRKQLTPNQIDS